MKRNLFTGLFRSILFTACSVVYFTNLSAFPATDSTRLKAEEFIRQAEEMAADSPLRSLKKAKEARKLLEQSGKKDPLFSKAVFRMAYAYFMLGETDSSVIWLNRILSLPETDVKTRAKSMNLLCIDYRKMGNNQKAAQMAHDALETFRSIHDSAGMMTAIINDAKIYQRTGNSKKAMFLYREALKYAEKLKDTLNAGIINSLIGNIYMDIEQIDKGKAYYRQAINVMKFSNNNYYGDILNNYGIVFYDEGKYDSALFYFHKALDVYKKINQLDAIGAGYQNIGITYVMMGNEKPGLDYLHGALDIFNKQKLPNDQASVMIDLGHAYLKTGRYDSADRYLQRALDISERINSTYYKKQALLFFYRLYEKQEKYAEALQYYKMYSTFKDSLENRALKENLQELEIKYHTAQNEREILRLKNREILDKSQKRLLIVGIVGLAVFLILTFIIFFVRRKKDLEIHRQKVLVYKKEKALAEAELEKKHAREMQMQNELEYKTKQLATHALNMMQKNKLLQDIKNDIEARLNSTDCKSREAMTQVKHSIQKGLNVDKDWDLFKLYFEQVNKNFFQNLKKVNTKLTNNDFRLAALIKLNMSIKEMASVLNISPDSLKNARYRLKKKLNLKEEENMNTFIRDL